MSPNPHSLRSDRYLLIALTTPVIVAILASLWPLNPGMVDLICCALGLVTTCALVAIRSLRQLFAGITTIAILLSVATSDWPLRAAYTLSRSSFDRVASQVDAGDHVNTPCWIGLFRIHKAEVHHNGVVCLWTDDDTAGPTGFVQYASDDLPFNLWSHIRLDNRWQFIAED